MMIKEKKNYTKREISDFTEAKHKFQLFGRWLVSRTFIPLFYDIEYTGTENIPTDKKFIVAPNHISYFDPFLAGEAIKKPIAFMGKKELFENPILAFLLDGLACFAVNREKLEVSTVKTALNIFKTDKWLLGIFPQGGIRRNSKIENVNNGFAVFAAQTKTDVLPLGITGCEKYNWNIFKKAKIKVAVGEIISHEQTLETIKNEWSRKTAGLIGYEFVEEKQEKTSSEETV